MTHVKQAPRGASHLAQAMPGYRGYSCSKAAHRSDRIFSEEVLAKLSEAVATVSRIRRVAGGEFEPDIVSGLDLIEEKAESLAQDIAETAFDERAPLRTVQHGISVQVEILDAAILERVGHVNQALAAIDIEGGAGISSEDLDSVCDLLDDLKNSIKRREVILNGKQR